MARQGKFKNLAQAIKPAVIFASFSVSCESAALTKNFLSPYKIKTGLGLTEEEVTAPFWQTHQIRESCHGHQQRCLRIFQIRHDDIPVYGASHSTITIGGELIYSNTNLPDTATSTPSPSYEWGEKTNAKARQVWFEQDGHLIPAWVTANEEGTVEEVIADDTGEILSSRPLVFHAEANANTYAPGESKLSSNQLTNLIKDQVHLDGNLISVYAPDQHAPRAESHDGRFEFDEFGASESEFDQVQAYFAAQAASTWYQKNLNWTNSAKVTVRLYDSRVSVNNALYLPLTREILVGAGDNERFQRIARDFDVLAHEMGHHLIVDFIPGFSGDAGALHEGFSDYFVYAMTGNPNLAELATVTNDYLRTALLGDDRRIDNPTIHETHLRGEIWAATLWSIRQNIGSQFDQVVFNALTLLNEKSTLPEALETLFASDLALNPLTNEEDPDFSLFGSGKCAIMSAAINRGFAQHIEQMDGSSCGLDLTALAAASRDYEKSFEDNDHLGFWGKPCGVLNAEQPRSSWPPASILLLIPLFFVLFRRSPNPRIS